MARIEFRQGEQLAADKMNGLAGVAMGATERGQNAIRSKDGLVTGGDDTRNYIDQYRPFDVYRYSATKLRVRCGTWTHYDGKVRESFELWDGSKESGDPNDFRTLSPTLAASTDYVVYIELDLDLGTLDPYVVAEASFPADADNIFRHTLCKFTTTAGGKLPDLQPVVGDIVTLLEQSSYSFDVETDDTNTSTINDADTLTISGGNGIDTSKGAEDEVVITADFSTATPSDVAATGSAGNSNEISHSNHVHRAPHWEEMQDATTDTEIVSDTDVTDSLTIGKALQRWLGLDIVLGSGGMTVISAGDVRLQCGSGTSNNINLSKVSGGLPTSATGLSTGDLFTQTATQLGGSGTTKVICIV